MKTDGRQVLQWVAGGLLVALGVSALVVYVYDSINARPVDASTTSLIALVVGVISSVFSFNVGATSTANATQQATAGTAGAIAAANGSASKVASAIQQAHSPSTPAAPADGASDSGGNGGGA